MTFDDVVNIALVGTGRAALKIAADDDAVLADALKTTRGGGAEDQLLSAAALLCAYELCGATPAASTSDTGDVAPDDQWPVCSRRAGDLLAQLLELPNTPTKLHLLSEWLRAAIRSNRRPPHALLPSLLNYGAANRSARDAVIAVVDRHGLWLMSLNKRWQFAAAEGEDAAMLWGTGNREQRTSALRRMREKQPAAARELVQSTWKEDGAEERTSFLEALTIGLSLADEPFLEATLDDRSKQVRAAAAGLLSRLAGSALVGRMIARVDALVSLKPGTAGGMLRKAKPALIEVALPPEPFDAGWARDGIVEKPQRRTGQRQWWLEQMLTAVPPSHWSTKWLLDPAECVAAATGDFAELMRDAWVIAAAQHGDADWLFALFKASLDGRTGGPRPALVANLPVDLQRSAVADVLSLPDVDPQSLASMFEAAAFEFDDATATLAFKQVEKLVMKSGANHNYHLSPLLAPLAMRIPAHMEQALAARCVGAAWDANRKALDQFFQTLQLRRDIQREFAS